MVKPSQQLLTKVVAQCLFLSNNENILYIGSITTKKNNDFPDSGYNYFFSNAGLLFLNLSVLVSLVCPLFLILMLSTMNQICS